MDSMFIKAGIAAWLRYSRKFPVVCFERGHLGWVPDILGLDENRMITEVEVKITVADFKADAKKAKWTRTHRGSGYGNHLAGVRQFYYAVPQDIAEKIRDLVPGNYGLISVTGDTAGVPQDAVTVVRKAAVNKTVRRATVREVRRMIRDQTGTLCSLAHKLGRGPGKPGD